MRAKAKGKHKMRRRFAFVIGVAAAGVMALGAQTAPAQAVVKYDSKLTINHEAVSLKGVALWHGGLGSEVRKCMEGRRVFLFQERGGPDGKLGSDRNQFGKGGDSDLAHPGWWSWGLRAPVDGRVYARVSRKVGDGFVCRADRSKTIKNGDLCPVDPPSCSTDVEEIPRSTNHRERAI